MSNLVLLDSNELENVLSRVVKQAMLEKEDSKTLTINAVAKLLGKSHRGVSNLVKNGFIKTTKSGLIKRSEVEIYLKNID